VFQVGESVVCPGYGAGRVMGISKVSCLGTDKRYYAIELLDGTGTEVWVAVRDAEDKGVRRPTPPARLSEVWRLLCAAPQDLPADYTKRYAIIRERIGHGDLGQIARALRDLWWKNGHVRRLTMEGKRLYDKALSLLATEVGISEGVDREAAADEILQRLQESQAARPVA